MKPEDYLTSVQIEKLQRINEDEILKDALYKLFLSPLHSHGVLKKGEKYDSTINFALTPAYNMLLGKREMWDVEKIGIDTLANAKACQLVEQGFGELDKFSKSPEKTQKEDNVAL